MKRTLISLLCLLLLLCFVPAPVTAEETHTVAASFYPVWIFAQNILKDIDAIQPVCLTAPSTGCLHDYQLLTGDMMTLHTADALLINGAGMEGYLDKVIREMPGLVIIDSSRGIALLEDEHDHDHEQTHPEPDEHDHEEGNAHIWLDPRNAIRMVQNLTDGLCALYPQYAGQMKENADAYIAVLEATDAALRAAIEALPRKDIVTFHEAFPYFAEAYGLHIVAVVAFEPEEPLAPAGMMKLCRDIMLNENGDPRDPLPPLFTEPQYSGKAAQTVSAETGAPLYTLDPIVTGDGAADSYERAMQYNLLVLTEALK